MYARQFLRENPAVAAVLETALREKYVPQEAAREESGADSED